MLVRKVDLWLAGSVVCQARAVIAFDRVPQSIGAALTDGADALGPLLRATRLEHFREVAQPTETSEGFVARRYRIYHEARPIADISERFDLSALEERCEREG